MTRGLRLREPGGGCGCALGREFVGFEIWGFGWGLADGLGFSWMGGCVVARGWAGCMTANIPRVPPFLGFLGSPHLSLYIGGVPRPSEIIYQGSNPLSSVALKLQLLAVNLSPNNFLCNCLLHILLFCPLITHKCRADRPVLELRTVGV